jgi:hypothetical protein
LVIYVGFGIYAGQRLRWWRALAAILLAAVIDSTLGWYVAALIGPARLLGVNSTTEIVGTALLATLLDVVFGGIGVGIGARVRRRPV